MFKGLKYKVKEKLHKYQYIRFFNSLFPRAEKLQFFLFCSSKNMVFAPNKMPLKILIFFWNCCHNWCDSVSTQWQNSCLGRITIQAARDAKLCINLSSFFYCVAMQVVWFASRRNIKMKVFFFLSFGCLVIYLPS